MNLEKLALLKVRRKMYAWAIEDCVAWTNEIKKLGGDPAIIKTHKKNYLKTLKEIDGEISRMRTAIDSLEDKTISKILSMRYDEGMKTQDIADKLFYSIGWTNELLRRGRGIIEVL